MENRGTIQLKYTGTRIYRLVYVINSKNSKTISIFFVAKQNKWKTPRLSLVYLPLPYPTISQTCRARL